MVIDGLALASGFQVMPRPRHWWGNRFVDLIAAVVADALEAAAWMRRVPFWWPGLGAPLWRDVTSDILYTLRKTNIAMENGPFEDVFPIENGDIPLLC